MLNTVRIYPSHIHLEKIPIPKHSQQKIVQHVTFDERNDDDARRNANNQSPKVSEFRSFSDIANR
jgi:hypothetical protein